jgi:two-component system chemotaxis response regulator CheB
MSVRPVEVLVVDDSPVMRMLLVHVLEADPRIRIAGEVDGGAAACDFVARRMPDVVLMDIHMNGMGGFEAARRIMETRPVPIVMCSAISDPREAATTFRAYDAGAVAVLEKPVAVTHPDFPRLAAEMRQTVRLMAEVKVVRRWPRRAGPTSAPASLPHASTPAASGRVRAVGIATSTGGPPALQTLLSGLPADFAAPVLIVQHITAGFLPGLVEWLAQSTPLEVCIAEHGLPARPGQVHLAPDGHHLGIDAFGRLQLNNLPAENGVRPSADCLFRSLARHCGPAAVGVVLTGMGRDGAAGLREMHDRGAATFAQDRESSVVHGMPAAAVALQAVDRVLPIERMAEALRHVVQVQNVRKE